MTYIELHACSAFSFLRGASNPEDLARTAARLGLPALALCDRDGLYGSPRLHAAAKEHGIRAVVGAELTLEDKCILPVLVASRTGYQNLCRLITEARLRGSKTESTVLWKELPAYAEGLLVLTGGEEGILKDPCRPEASTKLETLAAIFGKHNVFVEIQRHLQRGETWRNKHLVALARAQGIPARSHQRRAPCGARRTPRARSVHVRAASHHIRFRWTPSQYQRRAPPQIRPADGAPLC